MKRRLRSLQLALLGSIATALFLAPQQQPALAGGNDCPLQEECSFEKPNIMFIVDYSTSMNEVWEVQIANPCFPDPQNVTRWDAVVQALQSITQAGSYLDRNTHLALMRFGHDPAPAAGTTIPNDSSGLVDGKRLDVAWYDDQNTPWFECNGTAIGQALWTAGPPLGGELAGIESWTKGALDSAAATIDQTKTDHPQDTNRTYLNVVLTDGVWTGMDGTTPLAPANQNPAIPAAALYDDAVRTYVIAIAGDPAAEAAADSLANAGGTGPSSVHAATPEALQAGLGDWVQTLIADVVTPECVGGLPRIMILLDASSSMLNVAGGTMAGGQGETGWDQAREALAGGLSIFDVELLAVPGQPIEDLVHLGLAVFGHGVPAPGEQKIVVDYGPCTRDNMFWALDPNSSCQGPGCVDPWGGPPITWTFADGTQDPPGFDEATTSHMPKCDGVNAFCMGSGTYTHLGLQRIKDNQAAYYAAAQLPNAEFPATAQTEFINILITDGQYTGYSTNAQVQTELEQMFAAGITTHVIGFGDGVATPAAIAQLQQMADWGSGGALDYYDANNQAELDQALASIVEVLDVDPCCALDDCTQSPEPSTLEPDPLPMDEACDTTTDTSSSGMDTSSSGMDTSSSDTSDTRGTESSSDTNTSGTSSGSTSEGGNDEVAGDTTDTGESGGAGSDAGCSCAIPSGDAERGQTLGGLLGMLGVFGMRLVRRRRRTG